MGKKNKEIKTNAAQQPTDDGNTNGNPEVKEGFFRRHYNSAKEKLSEHKGLIGGLIVGAAAAAGGLYYFGREDDINESTLEATEAEAESPVDE